MEWTETFRGEEEGNRRKELEVKEMGLRGRKQRRTGKGGGREKRKEGDGEKKKGGGVFVCHA